MIAIVDTLTGALKQVVFAIEGEDLTGRELHDVPVGWPDDLVWDPAVRAFVPTPLGPVREAARRQVDRAAAQWRAAVASEGYGQEMTYLAKEAEARAFVAATAPDPAPYPLLAAEVGITAPTVEAVAGTVLAAAADWRLKAALIEAARLAAKRQIAEAADKAAIQAIVAGLQNPLA